MLRDLPEDDSALGKSNALLTCLRRFAWARATLSITSHAFCPRGFPKGVDPSVDITIYLTFYWFLLGTKRWRSFRWRWCLFTKRPFALPPSLWTFIHRDLSLMVAPSLDNPRFVEDEATAWKDRRACFDASYFCCKTRSLHCPDLSREIALTLELFLNLALKNKNGHGLANVTMWNLLDFQASY